MKLSLRTRIVLTLLPLLALMAALGAVAVVLLHRLGGRIDAILRENYDSVQYMERLKEALERIDSSFTFALSGREAQARRQFAEQWPTYLDNLRREQGNITLPGEGELVDRLAALTDRYRRQGDAFYAAPVRAASGVAATAASPAGVLSVIPHLSGVLDAGRREDYFGPGGLLDTFKEIKETAQSVLRLNQESMEQASRNARQTAQDSLASFGAVVAGAAILGVWLARRTLRAILRPIQAVTRSAQAIGAGNLDQIVPVLSHDELGRLADAFNDMARQLRHFRHTDYNRLLRTQQTSQATIDSFPAPVLVVDPEGRVELANPAARRLFGLTAAAEEQQARPPWEPPEALREPLRQALCEQRPYLPEEFDRAVPLRVGGEERSFLPRLLPIRAPLGHTLGAAVLLEDVTRFRLLDQVKSDLVATASHELKTPLTGLRLAVHLLLEEAVGPLTPKQADLLQDARDNAERLLAVVNNLLDLAQLEQGRHRLDLRPRSPDDLLRTAADAVRARAADKGVAVEVAPTAKLPPVVADAARLGDALGNLLDNALEYTDAGGRIILSASAEGGRVTLAVADTGRGIPPEYLPHVFERFFRVPGQSREGGTGLGLAIVREVVAAHGGVVTCDSRPGAGTVFRITLPAWVGDTEPSPARQEVA